MTKKGNKIFIVKFIFFKLKFHTQLFYLQINILNKNLFNLFVIIIWIQNSFLI